jgi:hypothetical protein
MSVSTSVFHFNVCLSLDIYFSVSIAPDVYFNVCLSLGISF